MAKVEPASTAPKLPIVLATDLLVDEVDVLRMWPEDVHAQIESAKWTERKEALEALLVLLESHPRLKTGQVGIYGTVMDELKKVYLVVV